MSYKIPYYWEFFPVRLLSIETQPDGKCGLIIQEKHARIWLPNFFIFFGTCRCHVVSIRLKVRVFLRLVHVFEIATGQFHNKKQLPFLFNMETLG